MNTPAPVRVVIKRNEFDEFEVPAPTTDEIYFTDDLQDAKNTLWSIHGSNVVIVVRRGTYSKEAA